MAKKYYWLKLTKDFYKRHDIKIIRSMPNGSEYVIFYQALLLESISHEGRLRFSDTIPYNEDMLAVITDTNIDIVRSAMKILIELGMVEILDDKTIYMAETQKLIGSESSSAERVRNHRKKQKALQCNTNETESNINVENCNTEIEIELELDKELEIEKENNATATTACVRESGKLKKCGGTLGKGVVFLTEEQDDDLLDKLSFDEYNYYVSKLANYIIDNNAKVKSHYKTILKWVEEDRKVK